MKKEKTEWPKGMAWLLFLTGVTDVGFIIFRLTNGEEHVSLPLEAMALFMASIIMTVGFLMLSAIVEVLRE